MNLRRTIHVQTFCGAAILLCLCGDALAQYVADDNGVPDGNSARSQWNQRVVRTGAQPRGYDTTGTVWPNSPPAARPSSPQAVRPRSPQTARFAAGPTRRPSPNSTARGAVFSPSAEAEDEQAPVSSQNFGRTSDRTVLTDYRFSPRPSGSPMVLNGPLATRQTATSGAEGGAIVGGAETIAPGQLQPSPADPTPLGAATSPGGYAEYGAGPEGCEDPTCGDGCGPWGGGCNGWGFPCQGGRGIFNDFWWQDFSLFAGVHGFKGPTDRGLNGNFGFQEGVNFGAPLGCYDVGYQVGFAADQSNLSGDQTLIDLTTARRADRHQYFLTAGLFRRELCCGFQWGVTFDLMRDVYYQDADLKQIRSETSFVFPGGCNELGYFGAYNVGSDRLRLQDRLNNEILLAPTDMFAGFFRRHFASGGEGRFWAGVSGRGNGLIGADVRVPLGGSFALENSFTYLVPKGRGGDAVREEAWGLNIQLVWYPGRAAACVHGSPYRPMFTVADNSTFLVHAAGAQTLPAGN